MMDRKVRFQWAGGVVIIGEIVEIVNAGGYLLWIVREELTGLRYGVVPSTCEFVDY